jgi:SpoVK/Ycf46/Vps4 family AAA+-type ATPase
MTGLVGGSEEKMRAVVSQAQSIAPCVLWIDEIEKSLSGTKSSNFSDGGTLARVFGTLLTSMEEGLKGVTIIATANDITMLPPELIRRFNEVFFVDLPQPAEREEVFQIHLKKRHRDPAKFDMKALAAATENYTGAEIEKAIKECIARCFNDGKRDLTTEDLIQAVKDTKPISTVMGEKVSAIRAWARDRARYASTLAAKAAAPGKQTVKSKSGKSMSVEDAVGDMEGVAPAKRKGKNEDTQATGNRFDNDEE